MKGMRIVASLALGFLLVSSAPAFADDVVTITVRNGATIGFTGTTTLQATDAPDISITPTSGTTSAVSVPARNVLGVLDTLDAIIPSFSLSNIGFFDFGTPYSSGLYIKCIMIPADSPAEACDNWQYTVNGSSPDVGVGAKALSNGDIIYLYFGNAHQIALSASSVTKGQSFTATAQAYNPATNTYSPLTGVTIGVEQGSTVIASSTVNGSGEAVFTIDTAGSYSVGIAEDFYFPTTALTVTAAPTSSSGGGGGGFSLHAPFDVPLALAFLEKAQRADGSFDSLLLSDWIAIAFAGGGAGDAQKKLSQYFVKNPPELQSVSDYERHAMALEALGINPYSGTSVDVIAPIVKAFDGTQVGDPSLINDDIFAIFPLLHAGYTTNDDIIQKTTSFIASKQLANGSWEGSVDMTAAAIQALVLVRQLPGASSAIQSAANYLNAQEQANGGFGAGGQSNSFSTSWVLQAIAAVPDLQLNWTKGIYYTPQYYLATLQQIDGGIEPASTDPNTRIWATAYAIPAVERKTWDSLLESFNKPVTSTVSADSGISGSSTETRTPEMVATSTPSVATPTVPVFDAAPAISTLASSSTTMTFLSLHPKAKATPKEKAPVTPAVSQTALSVSQTALAGQAVASAESGTLLHSVWQFIVSFFSNLF